MDRAGKNRSVEVVPWLLMSTLLARNGGYNGVRDTMLSQQSPATSYGNAGSIRALTLKTVDGGRRHFLSDARPLVGVMTRVEITPLEMPFELGGERLTISLYFRAPVRLRAE